MDKKLRQKKRLLFALLSGLALGGSFVWWTNRDVLSAADGRIFTRVENVPETRIALVLGTSPTYQGRPNLFFQRRMQAAAELYQAGKVKKLLVSGDNGSRGYDEPTAMLEALKKRGVPESDIVLDYAGFRTLDSVVRAKKIFGVYRCVIVTDDFHLPRALYIARHQGLEATGFQSEPLPVEVSPKTHVRELASRSLVWLDLHVLNRQPKFLGPREEI